MSGPYPPYHGVGAPGPDQRPDPRAGQPGYHADFGQAWGPYRPPAPADTPFHPGPAAAPYPGPPPPPVPYPGPRRRWTLLVAAVLTVAVVAAVAVAVAVAGREDSRGGAVLNNLTVQRAIQGYLDALLDGDIQNVSRNSLCGLYDGVRDRRADDALARLSSDAFQKQFSSVHVTEIDTMVFASPSSAQVLFTMEVVPTTGSRTGDDVRQGVAQVLAYGEDVLVCSYVLRTAGAF
ncbi:MAG: hypothetical protein WBB07_18520 [Mycobacterium sp.]